MFNRLRRFARRLNPWGGMSRYDVDTAVVDNTMDIITAAVILDTVIGEANDSDRNIDSETDSNYESDTSYEPSSSYEFSSSSYDPGGCDSGGCDCGGCGD